MRGVQAWLAPSWLLVFVLLSHANDGQPSIHAAAFSAVKNGEIDRSRILGNDNPRRAFDETNIKGGVLIGFDLGVSLFGDKEVVTALRPVYRTSAGLSYGREYGKFEMAVLEKKKRRDGIARIARLRAKPGYAVGGLRMRSGLGMDGLALLYHKIDGKALEATPSFKSEWVGNTTGGSESSLTTGGQPAVGVFGCTNDDKTQTCALGFVLARRDTESDDVRSGVAAKPAEKPKAQTKEQAREPEPEVPVATSATVHRDENLHYGFDIPDGWRPFSKAELDRVNSVLKSRYDAGFKPKDHKGNYPYVVVTKQLTTLAGLTLEEAEYAVQRDNHAATEASIGTLAEILGQMPADRAALDSARARVVTRSVVETPATGKVRTVTVYHMGAQAVIAVQCCAKDETFDKYLPAFARMNDSFAFDDGSAFQPVVEPGEVAPAGGKLWSTLLPLVVFAGVSGVVLVPLVFMRGKKKPLAEEEEEERPRKSKEEELDHEVEKSAKPQPRRDGTVELVTAGLRGSAHKINSIGPPPFFVVKSGNRWTRVYVMQEALLIIDIGVGKSTAFGRAAGSQGGALGGMIGGMIDDLVTHSNIEKMKNTMDKLDVLDTEDLVEFAKGGKPNFFLPVFELKSARIDAPTWWESIFHSALQGRLSVRHPKWGEFRFTFERVEDMKNAMHMLPDVLGDTLFLNVVLDRRSWKYVRK